MCPAFYCINRRYIMITFGIISDTDKATASIVSNLSSEYWFDIYSYKTFNTDEMCERVFSLKQQYVNSRLAITDITSVEQINVVRNAKGCLLYVGNDIQSHSLYNKKTETDHELSGTDIETALLEMLRRNYWKVFALNPLEKTA